MAQALAQVGEDGQARQTLQRALSAADDIRDGSFGNRAKALAGVAQALAQVGDREGLQRALAAAEGIKDEWARAWALTGIAQALVQLAGEGDEQVDVLVVQALRAARERGREEMVAHIQHFAPVLAKLGVIGAAWERMEEVESLNH